MKNTRKYHCRCWRTIEKLRQTLRTLAANHFAVLTAVDGEQALTLYYANNSISSI